MGSGVGGTVGSFQEQKNDSADSQQGQGKELNLANGLNAVGRRLTIRASRRDNPADPLVLTLCDPKQRTLLSYPISRLLHKLRIMQSYGTRDIHTE